MCILLFDEPHEPAQDAIIIAWANAIEAAGVEFTIWEDPTYQGVSESQEQLAAVCDVLCPNRTIFLRGNEEYRDFYRAERDKGTTLEFYSCSGPSTLLDPYSYFRLQAWTCWAEGATASYFWAFGDNAGGSSWNEYVLPRNIYTLTYLDDASATRSTGCFSRSLSTAMNSRVPWEQASCSSRVRNRAKHSGSPQSANGRACSRAPGLRSSSSR